MKKIKAALQFPGQGAQYLKMGKDFYDEFSLVRELFEEAEDVLKLPLCEICFKGDAELLRQTVNSQILIFLTSYSLYKVLQKQFPQIIPCAASGLSLGEYSALCALGYVEYSSILKVIRMRAKLMDEACQKTDGAMLALMGWTAEKVDLFVKELKSPKDVWIANYNCPGQIVLSGTKKGMEIALQKAKEQGVKRATLLNVQGAFHSGLMQSAETAFSPVIEELSIKMQPVPLVMNVSAKVADSEEEVRENLLFQITRSVLWEQSIRSMQSFEPDCLIEIGPGKTLTGFAKRSTSQGIFFSIEKLEDLDTLSASLSC